ncbi:MAG TPA: beta-propeller fold lactonase family protein [Terriglobia bacterium]|nr:beta-propeller fold lactonase family protein [Terriglobia bacterium]
MPAENPEGLVNTKRTGHSVAPRYSYDIKTGKITYNSAVTGPGTGLGWLAINTAGGSLYASEAGCASISIYRVSNGGLTLTEKTQFKLTGTATPGNLAFDPTGKFLYCLDNVHSTLHVLTLNQVSGQLTEPNAPTVLNEGTSEEALGLAAFSITQSLDAPGKRLDT